LLGISERTKRLGGKLSITSAPKAGTTIRITIPLESKTELNGSASRRTPDGLDVLDPEAVQTVHVTTTNGAPV
jgi:hypothetical protein